MTDYTYFVSGRVYARTYGSESGFEWPGLVDTINVAITDNPIQLPDRTQSGGGVYKEIRRIDSVALTVNHREFYPTTLARAIYGTSADVAGTTVNDEQHTVTLGRFVPLNHPGPYDNLSVTDGDPSDPAAIPASNGGLANYEIRGAGLWIPATAPDLLDDDTIAVTYDHPDYTRIQALRSSPPELELFFEGINEARDDLPAPARFHRVRFGPAEELALLSSDDFGALSLTGEVLKDTTQAAGLSQYFYKDIVAQSSS